MPDYKKTEKDILDLLPDRGNSINHGMSPMRDEKIKETVQKEQEKLTARELAKAKFKEKKQLETLERKIKDPESFLPEDKREKLQEKRMNIEAIEAVESQPVPVVPENILHLVGTTKPQVAKLLQSLNINTSVYLSKSDTYNLLSCLLTCNEQQLNAVYNNKKVPVAVKTVIKRLLEDAKLGNIETVEKLWDRIFGKAGQVTLELPQASQTANGIIPNTVVSREAYMIIRDTIIGKD